MPSPYWIWIIGNNSMALRVRYEQTIIVFPNMIFSIEIVVWKKVISDLIFYVGSTFQRHKPFSFTPEAFFWYFSYEEYEKKKRKFFLIWSYQKETLGLLNHRRDKYRKQQNHHSIFFYITIWMKGRVVNGSFNNLDRMDSFFFLRKNRRGKRKFHCRAVCNAQKVPVRSVVQFYFFSCFFFSPYFNPILQDRRTIYAWC